MLNRQTNKFNLFRKINPFRLLKISVFIIGISILFKNCENNEDHNISLGLENLENLNVKTVSFEDAKKFFNQKNEEIKRERKLYASKNGTTPLELLPDWNTLKHDDLIGIEKAQLTLSDVAVNREGDYISKLFFININDIVETVIFTIYQKKVTDDGKILEATLYFNKLDGQFLDGYKIENGLLTKRLVVKKRPNVQKAAMFLLLQVKQEEVDWNCLIGLDGGELNEISLTLSGGGSSGSNYQSPDRSTGGISAATSGNINTNYTGPGGGSYVNVTSLAGTLYTQASIVKTLAEGEERIINELTNPCAKNIFTQLENGIYQDHPLKPELQILALNTGNLNFSEIILHMFENSNQSNYMITNGYLDPGKAAETDPTTNTTTLSNSYLQNATRLSIARTMIHEQIHAFLNNIFKYRAGFQDKDLYSKMHIYASENGYTDLNRFHHEFMGQYVNAIAVSLYEWDSDFGSGGNLGWDYYYSMSFGGLFYDKNPDPNIVEIEVTDSFKELVPSVTDRNRIIEILKNEESGNSNAKGEKCN